MKNRYQYLIVGAGLYGSVFAHEMNKRGRRCLVIDKRPHVAGNIYTEIIQGIVVHRYGAHIFHTSDKDIWRYVNSFVTFNHFINSPIAKYKDELYNLPFNMNTFFQLWGVTTPEAAAAKIEEQKIRYAHITAPKNLEEQALVLCGEDIYEKLIKGYTEKQWGRPATEIPAFVIRRLPFRFIFDNNYYNDPFQGVPVGGYTQLVKKLLDGIEVRTDTNYFDHKDSFDRAAETVVFTGRIDEFFDYRFGTLDYRSLRFENELLSIQNYQGNAVVNYTDISIPYTRIIEHKHFEFGKQEKTYITREFPSEFSIDSDPFYPVNDPANQALLQKYQQLAALDSNVIFGGRLAEYKYYDMHEVIGAALSKVHSMTD